MAEKTRAVGVLLESQGEILILHRSPRLNWGNTWGLPAGIVEPGESDLETAIRELYEETGYRANPEELLLIDSSYRRLPNEEISFHVFSLKTQSKFPIKLDHDEHQDYKWISPDDCYNMDNLIPGLHHLLERVYGIEPGKTS